MAISEASKPMWKKRMLSAVTVLYVYTVLSAVLYCPVVQVAYRWRTICTKSTPGLAVLPAKVPTAYVRL